MAYIPAAKQHRRGLEVIDGVLAEFPGAARGEMSMGRGSHLRVELVYRGTTVKYTLPKYEERNQRAWLNLRSSIRRVLRDIETKETTKC